MKYPLNVKAQVRPFGSVGFMFYLSSGWRFAGGMGIPSHWRAFDTMQQIREQANMVVKCDCEDCKQGLARDLASK